MNRTQFLRRQAERLRIAREEAAAKAAQERQAVADTETAKMGAHQQGNLQTWQGLVEQRILDGMSQGLFENLQGAGKPLNLYDDAFVPEEMRMAFRVLRSNGLAPLWIEINQEIHDDLARMYRMREYAAQRWSRSSGDERERLREQYVRRIKEINEKIVNYNLIAPSSSVHMALLIDAPELAAFDNVTRFNRS